MSLVIVIAWLQGNMELNCPKPKGEGSLIPYSRGKPCIPYLWIHMKVIYLTQGLER